MKNLDQPSATESRTKYSITWADGRYSHRLAGRTVTLTAALADIRIVYPAATDGSDADSNGCRLVWESEEAAQNDDEYGSHAIASLWPH